MEAYWISFSRHISNIEIHPSNPDIFFVAVQGAQYGSSKEEVFIKLRRWKTWEKVLYINNKVGASSLSMDMNNPRILYAAMWEHERTPWQMKSGGPVQEFINLQMGAKIGQN